VKLGEITSSAKLWTNLLICLASATDQYRPIQSANISIKYIVSKMMDRKVHHRSIRYLLSSLINLIGDEPVPHCRHLEKESLQRSCSISSEHKTQTYPVAVESSVTPQVLCSSPTGSLTHLPFRPEVLVSGVRSPDRHNRILGDRFGAHAAFVRCDEQRERR
jgi:hypothetical protein